MAKQYDNNFSGALFKNDDRDGDTHPDYRGQAEVDGVEYWVSGWINVAKQGKREGEKFLSIKFTVKEDDNRRSNSRGSNKSSKGSRDF